MEKKTVFVSCMCLTFFIKFQHSANNKISTEFYKSGMNLVLNFLRFPNISSKIRLH